MPLFIYKARDDSGKEISGKAYIESREDLVETVSRMGYFVTQIRLDKESAFKQDIFERFRSISAREYAVLAIHLSTALDAGLPLLKIIETISEQIKSAKLKASLKEVSTDLKAGSSFSTALKKHPQVFNKYFVSMVQSGETTGKLAETLRRIASYMEKESEFKQKIVSSLAYPVVLALVAVGVIVFLMVYIMPKFIDIFKGAKAALPLPTMILISISYGAQHYWLYILIIIFGLVLAFKSYISTQKGRFSLDTLKINLPLFGKLFRKIYVSHFMRTLAMLYNSGVPILSSLKVVEETVGNTVFVETIKNLSGNIKEGQGIVEPLRLSGLFPPDAIMMISSGEESGKLGEMLEKSSQIYEQEIEYELKTVTSLFEPLVIVFMGFAVGFVALAVLLPIFRMSKVAF